MPLRYSGDTFAFDGSITHNPPVAVFTLLQAQMGQQTAEPFIEVLDDRVEEKVKSATGGLITREESVAIREKTTALDNSMQTIEARLNARFDRMEGSINTRFADLEGRLTAKIAESNVKIGESKVDMVKWMFSFFFALALMVIGLYFK